MTIRALDCALAGVRAVDPYRVTRDAVAGRLCTADRVAVVAMGKAAAAMARGALDALGDRVIRAIVVAPVINGLPEDSRVDAYVGGHPIPNDGGVNGARAVRDLARSLDENSTLVCLISGGASALTMLPAEGVALADLQQLTSALLRAGAAIGEINCVRKHLDQLKGGRLARLAVPARVESFILSDVIGDPLDVIASGPTVPDPTTISDAIAVLKRFRVWDSAAPAIRHYLENADDESPKPGDPCFAFVSAIVIGNNTRAAEAAKGHAESLGYETSIETLELSGEARDMGKQIAQWAITARSANPLKRQCFIYAGETTVTVTGHGIGGRNQELALGAAIALNGSAGITVVSMGTDGIDGPTDAAGAIADGTTVTRARTIGLDAERALETNDAYPFWRAIDGLIVTGPTGTNVMDLVVVTIDPLTV